MMSISGYGDSGPYAEARVYDQVVQAMAGVPSVTCDGSSEPSLFPNLLVDKVTALNAAQSVTAALLAKERGHGGQHVKLTMLDVAVHFLYPDAYWNRVWRETKPFPMEWRDIAANSEYHVADGKMAISATDKNQFWGLLEVADLPELKSESFGEMRAKAMEPVRARLKTMRSAEIFEKCLLRGACAPHGRRHRESIGRVRLHSRGDGVAKRGQSHRLSFRIDAS